MTKERAVSYLRVSTVSQVEGHGLTRQREAIKEFADKQGLRIIEEFKDEGVSGAADIEDRPGLKALVDRIAGNGVKVILIESQTRLARKLAVQEFVLEKFRAMGVRVFSVDIGEDIANTDDETRVLVRVILGAVSAWERSIISKRSRAARDKLRAEGKKVEGPKFFGNGTFPGEEETLERIKELRRKKKGRPRLGYTRIANILNEEGRPTRRGGKWVNNSVRVIVKRVAPNLS